ncbi:MAG: hypothetical protein IPJ61_19770 [Tessaracoccus sp.]|uniref:hypothetical protein n=1 Tax=Tessaracoccus sp. TaxID=1971211 RepID=UPI001EB73BC0|nr:hypothetical protein [Tessaracoccus sp.]MBK7823226.1 hypothetical protein [Tessaracoccus sp.]
MAIDPTPLLRINTLDLLMIWGDLVAAYYGRNGYGTDTAEIYAFRCADPGAAVRMRSDATQLADEGALAAAQGLHAVLGLFIQQYRAKVKVDGKLYGDWVAARPLTHRTEVQVCP